MRFPAGSEALLVRITDDVLSRCKGRSRKQAAEGQISCVRGPREGFEALLAALIKDQKGVSRSTSMTRRLYGLDAKHFSRAPHFSPS
jgi:hypothetical protein